MNTSQMAHLRTMGEEMQRLRTENALLRQQTSPHSLRQGRRQFRMPAPPRRPIEDEDTAVLAAVSSAQQVPWRIVVWLEPHRQLVTVYDHRGVEIPQLCGLLKDVYLRVIEQFGLLEWEVHSYLERETHC